jgi:hypothetical protein
MSDLLSSASLLLTLIALLYGMWYQEIVAAIDTFVDDQPADRKPGYDRARGVYLTKAMPLAVAAVILTLVFTPETIKVMIGSLEHARADGWRAIYDYDAVSTSLILVTLGSGFFAGHLVWSVSELTKKIGKLNPKAKSTR